MSLEASALSADSREWTLVEGTGVRVQWALPSAEIQAFCFPVGESLYQVVPLAPSTRGNSGLFMTVAGMDEFSESPTARILTCTEDGNLSKKKIQVVLVELPLLSWSLLSLWDVGIEAADSTLTQVPFHAEGLLPRLSEVKRICKGGPIGEWISEMASEGTDGYHTGLETPVPQPATASQTAAANAVTTAQNAALVYRQTGGTSKAGLAQQALQVPKHGLGGGVGLVGPATNPNGLGQLETSALTTQINELTVAVTQLTSLCLPQNVALSGGKGEGKSSFAARTLPGGQVMQDAPPGLPESPTPLGPTWMQPSGQHPNLGHGSGASSWSPVLQSLDNPDEGFSRMARGSAGVAEIVQVLEFYPWLVVEDVEKRIMRERKVFYAGQAWSTEEHCTQVCRQIEGHKTLKKLLTILAHTAELLRQRPQNPEFARAFVLQGYKAGIEAGRNNGNWELAWPLLGIPSPEEGQESLTAPAERVALVALQKEKKLLKEASDRAVKGD